MPTIKVMRAVAALAVLAGTLATAVPANAASYSLTLDPEFGSPFLDLGWQADVLFDAPASCIAVNATYGPPGGPLGACAGLIFNSVVIGFYNKAAPNAILESFTFAPPAPTSITNVIVAGNQVVSLAAGPFNFFTPTGASSSIAGNGLTSFALVIDGGSTVDQTGKTIVNGSLYYSSLDPFYSLTGCLLDTDPNKTCGVSKVAAKGFITPIPEPATYALAFAALAALGLTTRRRQVVG